MKKQCLQCNKEFISKNTSKKRRENAKFCSVECYRENQKSNPNSGTFKKGHKIYSEIDTRKKQIGELNNNWKGGKITLICKVCNSNFTVIPCRKNIAKTCSLKCDYEYRRTEKFRISLSETQREIAKQLGNIRTAATQLDKVIRKSVQYRIWREVIFERDNYTCQFCSVRGGSLQADHIKQFAIILLENDINSFEEALLCKELWDINNGRTLCKNCHKKTPTYARRLSIN